MDRLPVDGTAFSLAAAVEQVVRRDGPKRRPVAVA